MGTFQGYKFQTVDKPLTAEQRKSVSSLSSRAEVSSNSATFIYHYGDFRGDPMTVLRDYFDLHLYFANWGTKQLMIKFPINLVDYWELKKYEISYDFEGNCGLSLTKSKDYIILDFEWNEEEGGGWMDIDDYDLSDFIVIREAILDGDFSALYLFWLKIAAIKADVDFEPSEYDDDKDFDETRETPPISAKLANNKKALQPFIDLFEIDEDLVGAAVLASKKIEKKEEKVDYSVLLQEMSETEKDTFLMQVLDGEPRVDIQLKKYLDSLTKKPVKTEQNLTLTSIFDLQSAAKTERKAAEKAAIARALKLKNEKTAREEKQIWKSVFFNLDRKSGSSYDLATSMLVDLKDLAIYQNDIKTFNQKMADIRANYGRSKVLLERFVKANL
jgi:hypothetical protein